MRELLEVDTGISIYKVKVEDVEKWSEYQLNKILGFEVNVEMLPKIGTNRLNYNIDETTMTDEQWEVFIKELDTFDGRADRNFIELLKMVYGEANYHYYVTELNSFYIIRDNKEEN